MIKENQRLLNQLNIFSDGVLAFFSMLAAYWIRFHLLHGTMSVPFHYYVYLAVIGAITCLLTYALAGLYESYRAIRFYREAARFLMANLLDTVLLVAGLFVFHLNNMSRWTLVLFFLVSTFLLLGKRACLRLF